jgi:hypothetical protein
MSDGTRIDFERAPELALGVGVAAHVAIEAAEVVMAFDPLRRRARRLPPLLLGFAVAAEASIELAEIVQRRVDPGWYSIASEAVAASLSWPGSSSRPSLTAPGFLAGAIQLCRTPVFLRRAFVAAGDEVQPAGREALRSNRC